MSDSEDEYGPICATWGTQTPATPTENPTDAWKSLVDPNIKLGPNDLGSGNLHRRGHNFKPIDEEIILAQRNKVVISKKKMKEAIKQSSIKSSPPQQPKKKSNSTTTTTSSSSSRKQQQHHDIPTLSTIRPQHNSVWSSSNLVETPFWEAQANNNNNNKQTTTSATSAQPPTNNNNNTTKLGTSIHETQTANEWGQSDNTNWGIGGQQQSGWEEYDKKKSEKTTVTTAEEPQQQHHWGAIDDKPVDKKQVEATNGWSNKQETASSGWGSVETKTETVSGWGSVDTAPKKVVMSGVIITTMPKEGETANGWGSTSASPTPDAGWGTTTTQTEANGAGWDKKEEQSNGWGNSNKEDVDASGWSNWSSEQILESNKEKTTTTGVSDKPSWLSSPTQHHTPQPRSSSRFSIASKGRYTPHIDVPEPINYKRNGRSSIPTATAPPPPPENRHLITINVELSSDNKIPVKIRELDDPLVLAQEFAKTHNISSDKVVQALTNLFRVQKDQALKLRNAKLKRRMPPPVYNNNNYHNNFDYSAYEASPVYQRPESFQRPTTTATPTTTTTRYSRKSYF